MNDAALARPRGLARALDDVWNPVLVKEVRQALRGRLFRIAFTLTLTAAVFASITMTLDMGSSVGAHEGRAFFQSIYVCLSFAMFAIVPFYAFNSMGAEWEENTYELLSISNLVPRQIVLGKLLAAGVQATLFVSGFGPFLVYAFLLRGVDLFAVLTVLGLTVIVSAAVSTFAVMLSTVSRNKFARVLLMLVLGGLAAFVIPFANVAAGQLVSEATFLRDADTWRAIAAIVVGIVLAAAFAFATACNLVAHPEENRSTNIRVLTSVALLAALATWTWVLLASGITDREAVFGPACGLAFALGVPALFLTTENEALGRRVVPRVPRSLPLALAAGPWLPGGARGAQHFVLHLGVLLVWTFALQGIVEPGRPLLADGGAAFLLSVLYALVYVLLPSGVLSSFTAQPPLRAVVRVLVPLLVVLFAFAPSLVGLFLGDQGLLRMEHPGNPGFFLVRAWDAGDFVYPGYWSVLLVLGGAAALANAPRTFRSVRELVAARSSRLARERAEAARRREAPEAA